MSYPRVSYSVSLLKQSQGKLLGTTGKKFLVFRWSSQGFNLCSLPHPELGTTVKSAPFWSKESHFPKGLLPTFTALCNCLGNLLLCTDLDCLHDKRILQKFSLVPMSANGRHEQAAEQRTMHRRDVLEIKIPVHFPIGIICSHSTKIHRQGVSQPKKRLLIFVDGLHKLLLHCPNLPLN